MSIIVFWICVCLWARKVLHLMQVGARQMLGTSPQPASPQDLAIMLRSFFESLTDTLCYIAYMEKVE
jgi:hypothetical protein